MTLVSQTDASPRFKSGTGPQNTGRPEISVLVPAKDEAENLPLFMEQARAAFAAAPQRYEVIVVDDGSVDDSWAVLQRLTAEAFSFSTPPTCSTSRKTCLASSRRF